VEEGKKTVYGGGFYHSLIFISMECFKVRALKRYGIRFKVKCIDYEAREVVKDSSANSQSFIVIHTRGEGSFNSSLKSSLAPTSVGEPHYSSLLSCVVKRSYSVVLGILASKS